MAKGINTIVSETAKTGDAAVEAVKRPAFYFTVGVTYLSYILIFLGISYLMPQYIRALSNIAQIVICLILIYKFNPLREKYELTEFDNNLIFFTAFFIIMSTGLTEFTLAFFNSMKSFFNNN